MTSPYERPDRDALRAVVELATAAEEELAAWRRRALSAEAQAEAAAAATEVGGSSGAPASPELLAEVTELRRRLAGAREMVDLLRTRLRFLEERNEGAA